MVKKSKSRSKSKRSSKSKSRSSHKGLIAGLSIGGVVALIAGVLVVLYLTGVLEKIFKKKSKPRVNDKRGTSDKRGPSTMLDTFETSYDSESYRSIINFLSQNSGMELTKREDGRYFIRGFGINAQDDEVKDVVIGKNLLKFKILQNTANNEWISYTFSNNPNKITINGKSYLSKYVYYPDKGTVIIYRSYNDYDYGVYPITISDTVFNKKSKSSQGSVPRKKVTVLDTFDKKNGPLPSQFEVGRESVQTYRYDNNKLYLTISNSSGELVDYLASIQKNPEFYEYFEIKIEDLGLIYKFTQDILTEAVKDTENTVPDLLLLQSVKDSDQSHRIYHEEATYEHYPDANVVVVIHASGNIVLPDVLFR